MKNGDLIEGLVALLMKIKEKYPKEFEECVPTKELNRLFLKRKNG